MVTAPQLSRRILGVTGDAATLAINDRILRIEVNPRFVRANPRWKPYPSHPYAPPRPPLNLKIMVVGDRAADPGTAATAPADRPAPGGPFAGWDQR